MSGPVVAVRAEHPLVVLFFRYLLLVQLLLLAIAIPATVWSIATGVFNGLSVVGVIAWALAITTMRMGEKR